MSLTAKLGLPDFDPLLSGVVAFNHASWVLDSLLHCEVRQFLAGGPLSAVPLPGPGEIFLISDNLADGPWENHQFDMAIGGPGLNPADNSTHGVPANWKFVTPVEGFVVWLGTDLRYTYNDSGWFAGTGTLSTLNGEVDTFVRDRIIAILDLLRGHGVIAT